MAVRLLVRWVARAGEEAAVAAIIEEVATLSQAEPGCRHYIVSRDRDDHQVFVLFEEYVDEAALEEHAASEHFRELVLGRAVPLLDERVRTFLTPFA